MINKFFKLINNKFSRIFKFIFFIRYLVLIFSISTALFLLIPNFFDYNKRENIIKLELQKNYNVKLNLIKDIEFKTLPTPRLIIKNLESSLASEKIDLISGELIVFPKLSSIYDFNNLKIKKVIFYKNQLILDVKNTKVLSKYIAQSKNKIHLNDLKIQLKNLKDNLINLEKINFSNYGHGKNILTGKAFNQKFKIGLHNNNKEIKFKLLNTGLMFSFKFSEDRNLNHIKGIFKGKILNSNLKSNFVYNYNFLELDKFTFRNKNLSLNSQGKIILKPYSNINLTSEIIDFNKKIFKNINIDHLFKFKKVIQKINSKNDFVYKPTKFSGSLIENLIISTSLAYGRLNISKNFTFEKTDFKCDGNIDILQDYPVLNFHCLMSTKDKKKFLRKLNKDYKNKDKTLDLEVKGRISILNKKINFEFVNINNTYNASKEDLVYYKKTFEKIILNKGIIEIFDLTKIKNFVKEIS